MAKRKVTSSVDLEKANAEANQRIWDCHVLRYHDEIGSKRWLVEKFLGKGGFGAVYRAADRQDPAQKVAVKIFSGDVDHDDNKGKERIVREAEILRAIGDKRAPHLYEDGVFRDRPYIIMEYLDPIQPDGDDLPSRSAEIRNFFMVLLESVKTLHQKGWIHCDIKPGNIAKRKSDDRYVLIDFGSAHEREAGEHTPNDNTINTCKGEQVRVETRGYAPPELCYQPCRDIYALGHVIRDCFKEDVPLRWSVIINKCISNNPNYRYQDVEALMEEIKDIDDIGQDEMRRCTYDNRCRFIKDQKSIAEKNPREYPWLTLKDKMEDLQKEGPISPADRELFIDFEKLSDRSIRIARPVTLRDERYVVIKGPGQLIVDLDACLAGKDGNGTPKRNPAVVFLWNNVTLINNSKKRLEEGNIFYIVGECCYLNFPNVSAANPNLKYFVKSNLGYSFVYYKGPPNMSELIDMQNSQVQNGIPEIYMMTAQEPSDEGPKDELGDRCSISRYIEKNSIIRQALGLPPQTVKDDVKDDVIEDEDADASDFIKG